MIKYLSVFSLVNTLISCSNDPMKEFFSTQLDYEFEKRIHPEQISYLKKGDVYFVNFSHHSFDFVFAFIEQEPMDSVYMVQLINYKHFENFFKVEPLIKKVNSKHIYHITSAEFIDNDNVKLNASTHYSKYNRIYESPFKYSPEKGWGPLNLEDSIIFSTNAEWWQ